MFVFLKLEELMECGSLEDYKPLMPSRTYTYLLNDTGEEFKRKPILMNIFSDEPEEKPKKTGEYTSIPDDQPEEKPKKGFFAKLFGKK